MTFGGQPKKSESDGSAVAPVATAAARQQTAGVASRRFSGGCHSTAAGWLSIK
jgi:hypothetical protein